MRKNELWLVMLLICALLLVGCQKEEVTQPDRPEFTVDEDDPFERFRTGEIGQMNTLVLGILLLDDTDDAVTQEQAADLLPLWQVIQSGGLKSQAETDAVLKQIEGVLSDSQLRAIADMALTRENMTSWMEEQGVDIGEFGGGGPGGFGQMGDLTDEERAELREQFQSLRDLSPEERQERMAEMGFEMPEGFGEGLPRGEDGNPGGFGGAARSGNFLLTPLLDYLTERATE